MVSERKVTGLTWLKGASCWEDEMSSCRGTWQAAPLPQLLHLCVSLSHQPGNSLPLQYRLPVSMESCLFESRNFPFFCVLFTGRASSKDKGGSLQLWNLMLIKHVILKNMTLSTASSVRQHSSCCALWILHFCQEWISRMKCWLIPAGYLFLNKSAEC